MPSSRESSLPRDWTYVAFIAGGFFTIWATREACKTIMLLFSHLVTSDSLPAIILQLKNTFKMQKKDLMEKYNNPI